MKLGNKPRALDVIAADLREVIAQETLTWAIRETAEAALELNKARCMELAERRADLKRELECSALCEPEGMDITVGYTIRDDL